MILKKKVEELFLEKSEAVWIDVRSPLEYAKGHIPGSVLLPLFSNEARAIIGTIYKQVGKEAAIEKGLSLVDLSNLGKNLRMYGEKKPLVIYCARGGMRSSSVAWLAELLGLSITVVQDGYKGYRKWVLSTFEKRYRLTVIGGKTGSGKTELLHRFLSRKEAVLDLENLALHRGSVFGRRENGSLSQEHFENLLAKELFLYRDRRIFVEDESRFVGPLRIPDAFFSQMREAPVYVLHVEDNERVERICREYGTLGIAFLKEATSKLQKRLGSELTVKILSLIEQENFKEAALLLFPYYDRLYNNDLTKRDPKTVFYLTENSLKAQEEILNSSF